MQKLEFQIGDRVKFSFDGMTDTGTILSMWQPGPPIGASVYMDTGEGHGMDGRCWNVPFSHMTLLKPKKTKVFK